MPESIFARFYAYFLLRNTAFVFCVTRWYFMTHHISDAWSRRLVFLGGISFGVMLFEEITRNLTHIILSPVPLVYPYRFPFFDAVIWITLAYALGVVLTWGIKKIPYFRKLI